MGEIATIILAGGAGKRMHSQLPKVLHPLCGRPMIDYPLQIAKALGSRSTIVVTPWKDNGINDYLKQYTKVRPVRQRAPLGTADAVRACESSLNGKSHSFSAGTVLILCGDTPLLRADTLKDFLNRLEGSKAILGFISTHVADPVGYGRVLRSPEGEVQGIVEECEANPSMKAIREINTGIYAVKKEWLFATLRNFKPHPITGEYYLTDIIAQGVAERKPLLGFLQETPAEFLGVNSRSQLAMAEQVMRRRLAEYWMDRGVTFTDPDQVYLDASVSIGRDTVISPQVSVCGKTQIGRNCTIENGVLLRDVTLGDGVSVKAYSILEGAKVGKEAQIGPFARLRPGSVVGLRARIGNFVEMKNTRFGAGAKANHLSYLGDAIIGAETNIGCGTITCNYDGKKKHPTKIGKGVFVGSDVQFVAPVTIGRGATIGAGSTITENVPADALGIARGRQVNKKGWAKRSGKR